MTEYIFPLNGDLLNKPTAVHSFAAAQTADCGCCRPIASCACLIPGPEGPQGEAGATPTFTIGTVTAGETPEVTLTGAAPDYVLNFVLPTAAQPAE